MSEKETVKANENPTPNAHRKGGVEGMSGNAKVFLSENFQDAFAALQPQIQGKVRKFINKFSNNPMGSGTQCIKLADCQDGKFYSARIDDVYRAIFVRLPETAAYQLLWVDSHDDAYAWVKNKMHSVNTKTGAIEATEWLKKEE